jgi:2-keto-4-pentenoate hydratase/2-oxohepta-3-ene-1,7-dioic acid hydratase in catechol pathway
LAPVWPHDGHDGAKKQADGGGRAVSVWVSFEDKASGTPRCGVLVGDAVHAFEPDVHLIDLIGVLEAAARAAAEEPAGIFTLDAIRLRAPVPVPPSVRDFYAFEQHVKTARERRGLEMEPDWYELPVFYFSNPAAIYGPDDDVPAAPGTAELDYELEVAAVVGRAGRDLSPAEAERHIAGFTIMNDWSARDVQRREMKLNLGPAKGKDFATSLGPVLVTPDELLGRRNGHVYDLAMVATVNGREWSRGNLADIHWSFGEMLAYASRGTTLRPGDVIGSGTCGTGCILELALVHGDDSYPWLREGDEVTLTVEGLGELTNRIVAGTDPLALR